MHLDLKNSSRKILSFALLALGILLLVVILLMLRLAAVTDYMYHAMVKDPVRKPPEGSVIVAPADGTVLYVKKITSGMIPEMVKRGVAVPIEEHLKLKPSHPLKEGYLIGIYMNTQSVHINRVPNHGVVNERFIFNGPSMDMSETEREVIMSQLIPGAVSLRKALGLPPFNIRDKSEYILKSARETLIIEEERGTTMIIVRIADYYMGKILTWVKAGSPVKRGQKLGMIAWGSQTDLFIEASPGLLIKVRGGEYIYGGETVLATY